MHGVTRIGIKDKSVLRYIRPFEIVERINDVAYCLNLPPQFVHVHDIFRVFILKKYTPDLPHILPYVEIPLQPYVTYKLQPIKVLAKEICMLHNKETHIVKVRWEKHSEENAIWELESNMYKSYPHLF